MSKGNRTSYIYHSTAGPIEIVASENALLSVKFTDEESLGICDSKIIMETVRQLEEYFDGVRSDFDLPMDIKGTDFQKKVWNILCEIPYGKTVSYSEVANHVGCKGGQRAVANACNRNQFHIIIPCHRVVGAGGNLTGYAAGLDIKTKLLAIEKQ